jgi:quercetin dioxygenase-like cupin family protein
MSMGPVEGCAVIHLPGEGRNIDMGVFRMTVKAEAADTGGAFTLLEASEPAGFGPPMHTHEDAAEAFYVLEGTYVIFVEDSEFICPAGTFVHIPAGVTHGFRVGGAQSRKLNIYTPAAMVGYFDELSQAAATDTPMTTIGLTEMAARHFMRVLGPVPEGYA